MFRSIRNGRDGCGRGNHSQVVLRAMCRVTLMIVARCQSPAFAAVSFILLRIIDAISTVDQGMCFHLLTVVGITVFESARIESEIGIMCKEERAAKVGAQGQADAVIFFSVLECNGVGPPLMIHRFTNRISRRRSRQNISDMALVLPFQLMVHRPSVIG